eukprot:GGOE01036517.1.p1 GENE.GGOE01036517.1~~GGOE01036517.1.p1  ORF type:complete len:342 (+),score=39.00 GGOE01036517.1:31-1056(+)
MPPCGRSVCSLDPKTYQQKVSKEIMHIAEWRNQERYKPSFNLGPGQWAPVLLEDPKSKVTVLHTMKWGLIPPGGPSTGASTVNARCESLTTKPLFRPLLDSNRCVILNDGFYEWKKTPGSKKPYFVRLEPGMHKDATDVELCSFLPMAGLYNCWHDPATGEHIFSFTIITTDAPAEFAAIHDRVPCILDGPEAVALWASCSRYPFQAVKYLLKPHPGLCWYEVSPLVGSILNNSPDCMKLFDEKSGIGKFFANKMEASPCTATQALHTGPAPLSNQTSLLPAPSPPLTSAKLEPESSADDVKPSCPTRVPPLPKRGTCGGLGELPRKQQRTLASFFKVEPR